MTGSRKKAAVVLHIVEGLPWAAMVREDIEAALIDHPEIAIEFADPKGQIDKQIQLLEEYLSAKLDALVVYPVDAQKIRPVLQKYQEAGIPVIVLGSDPGDPELYRTLIMANNRQFGRAAGEFFAEIMEGEGDLVEICGIQSFPATVDRSAGFREALASHPRMRIIEQCTANWQCEQARQEFAQILTRHAKIDGVYAHNDEMARGVWEAAAAVDRDHELLITGIDAIRGQCGVQMVINGQLAATFINPSPGRAAFDAMLSSFAGRSCSPKRLLHTSALRSTVRIRSWRQDRRGLRSSPTTL